MRKEVRCSVTLSQEGIMPRHFVGSLALIGTMQGDGGLCEIIIKKNSSNDKNESAFHIIYPKIYELQYTFSVKLCDFLSMVSVWNNY